MNYSDVINNNLIQPKKDLYTLTDVKHVQTKSLFKPVNGHTLTMGEAVFIIKCSAIYHETEYSKPVRDWRKSVLEQAIENSRNVFEKVSH